QSLDGEVVGLGGAGGEDHSSRGGADQAGELGAGAVERGARFEAQGGGRRRGADAALGEGPHDGKGTWGDRGERSVVEVDPRRRGGAATWSFGRGSGRPRHPSRSPGARAPYGWSSSSCRPRMRDHRTASRGFGLGS